MFRATLAWRSEIKLDTLYADFPWTKARLAFRQFYPTYFHKEDLSGSPIHIHELGKLDIDKVGSANSLSGLSAWLWLTCSPF